jgi:predicted dehydrogenase
MENVRVGLIGTSWWADAMYLPALETHPRGRITAIAGRTAATTTAMATRWGIADAYTSAEELIASAAVDAVIIASSNASHAPLALAAIDRGLHVLCEKPLGLDADEAGRIAEAATRAGIISMTPFTYRFMPLSAQLRRYIDEGYIGRPYHMGARYFTGFARDGEYAWRFDRAEAGSGVLGDLGSHWIDMAMYLLGPIDAISATTSTMVPRAPRPDGARYDVCDDVAMMTVRFTSGATGQLLVSAVAWEGTPFGQTHEFDVVGSEGTMHAYCDWDTVQQLRGVRAGQTGPAHDLPRSPDVWHGLRTDTLHNTYRDVFRTTEAMTRGWVSAIAEQAPVQPDLAHGAQVQRAVDAALRSASTGGGMIPVG